MRQAARCSLWTSPIATTRAQNAMTVALVGYSATKLGDTTRERGQRTHMEVVKIGVVPAVLGFTLASRCI